MAELLRTSEKYNRRVAIIEGLRIGRSPTEIARFFGYSRSIVNDIAEKYAASKKSQESFADKENSQQKEDGTDPKSGKKDSGAHLQEPTDIL